MNLTLPQVNRIASIIILPMMTLAIVVFAQFADSGESRVEPPSAGTVIVANLREETLSLTDLKSGQQKVVRLPGPPHEMVTTGGRIYITLGRGDALAEVDAASAAIVRVLPLEGEPHGIALYGGNLVVTLDKANEAVVLDRATLSELRRYPTGDTPHAVAVSSETIVVTDSRDNLLRQLEPGHRTVLVGAQPESLALIAGLVASADAASGSVTIASARDLSGAVTIAVGAAPVRVVALAESEVLVALQGEGEVAVVDAIERRVVRRVKTAARPDGICLSPDGRYFAVASNATGRLEVFSTEDWRPVAWYAFEPGLGGCLWN